MRRYDRKQIEKYTERSWLEIDLAQLRKNVEVIKRQLASDVKLAAVVKADAYGLGARVVSKAFLRAGADLLMVASLDEALELRHSGVHADILMLSDCETLRSDEGIRQNILFTVSTWERAESLSLIAQNLQQEARIHINIDTGMGRLGFTRDDKCLDILQRISLLPGICIEGIYTHFATADGYSERGDAISYHHVQLQRFLDYKSRIEAIPLDIPCYHAANSASTVLVPESHFNLVRAGLILYGVKSENMPKDLEIEPCFALYTRIAHIRTLAKAESASYGRSFFAPEERKIAILPIGYADGYRRLMSDRAWVLVRGQRVPVVGKITMDQCMVDVTGISDVKIGDQVELLGPNISIEEMSTWQESIPYEVLSCIMPRVSRIYKDGVSYFKEGLDEVF